VTIILGGGVLMVLLTNAHKLDDPHLRGYPFPKKEVVQAAKQILQSYLESKHIEEKVSVDVNYEKGIVETDWYLSHKGEVRLKVRVVVWGAFFNFFRISKSLIFFNSLRFILPRELKISFSSSSKKGGLYFLFI